MRALRLARSSTDRVADFESEGCRFESYRAALVYQQTYGESGTNQESLAHALPTSDVETVSGPDRGAVGSAGE